MVSKEFEKYEEHLDLKMAFSALLKDCLFKGTGRIIKKTLDTQGQRSGDLLLFN